MSWLLGHFRWFSSFGRYLDRFGLRFSIIYVGISFWDALSVDFEPDSMLWMSNMLPHRPPESSISTPGAQGGPQGVPRELPRVEIVIQTRFLVSILRSFSMPESIKFQDNLKSLKSWPPERILMEFELAPGWPTSIWSGTNNGFCSIFIVCSSASEKPVFWYTSSKWLQNDIENAHRRTSKTRSEC